MRNIEGLPLERSLEFLNSQLSMNLLTEDAAEESRLFFSVVLLNGRGDNFANTSSYSKAVGGQPWTVALRVAKMGRSMGVEVVVPVHQGDEEASWPDAADFAAYIPMTEGIGRRLIDSLRWRLIRVRCRTSWVELVGTQSGIGWATDSIRCGTCRSQHGPADGHERPEQYS